MRVGNNYAFNRFFKNKTDEMNDQYQLENATVEGVGSKTLILLFTTLVTSMIFIGLTVRFGINILLYIFSGIFTFVLQLIIYVLLDSLLHI